MKRKWRILIIATALVVTAIIGAVMYERGKSKDSVAEAEARLATSQKATEDLDRSIQSAKRDEKLANLEVELARMKEDAAKKAGDAVKVRELAEQTRKAEDEAKKQSQRTRNLETVRTNIVKADVVAVASVPTPVPTPAPVVQKVEAVPEKASVVASVKVEKHQEGFDGDWKGEWACGEFKIMPGPGVDPSPFRRNITLVVQGKDATLDYDDGNIKESWTGTLSGNKVVLQGNSWNSSAGLPSHPHVSATFSENSLEGKGTVNGWHGVLRECTLKLARQ